MNQKNTSLSPTLCIARSYMKNIEKPSKNFVFDLNLKNKLLSAKLPSCFLVDNRKRKKISNGIQSRRMRRLAVILKEKFENFYN